MYGWKTNGLFVDDLVKYMDNIKDERPFKSTYKPTWYIDTEWTWLNSESDYWRPKPIKRLSPPEDKIDNKTLSEII